MIRALSATIAVAIACAIAATTGPAVAAAAAPSNGTLTATEYEKLVTAQAQLKKAVRNSGISWVAALRACKRIGTSTPLLKTQRDSCVGQLGFLATLVLFLSDQAKCSAAAARGTGTTTTGTTTTGTTTTGTTTTGTTTTGTTTTGVTPPTGLSGTAMSEDACLDPDYQTISRTASGMYLLDLASHKLATSRGFTGLCLATLSEPASSLAGEKRLASSAKKLAADVALLTKVANGHAPASGFNVAQFGRDDAAFARAELHFFGAKNPQNLSVCPHA